MIETKGKCLNMFMALPIRGGNWNNSSNAGVFNLNCNNPRTNSNGYIGARPDSELPRILKRNGGTKGGSFLQKMKILAKSAEFVFLVGTELYSKVKHRIQSK